MLFGVILTAKCCGVLLAAQHKNLNPIPSITLRGG